MPRRYFRGIARFDTLNIGVRFDIDTPFRDKLGRTVNGFNPTATNSASAAAASAFKPQTVTSNGVTASVASINTLGGLTFPNTANGAPYNTNSGFLSSRFGFSYSPSAAPDVSSATASNFGYITAVAANSQPRQIQLGARIVF